MIKKQYAKVYAMKTKIVILTFSLLVYGFVTLVFSYDHVRYVDIVNGDDANAGTSPGAGAWENLLYAVEQINVDNGITTDQTVILHVAPGSYYAAMAPTDSNVVIRINNFTIMGEAKFLWIKRQRSWCFSCECCYGSCFWSLWQYY